MLSRRAYYTMSVLPLFGCDSGRRMNDDMKATLIPKHDVPISLVVRDMSQEKKAVSSEHD